LVWALALAVSVSCSEDPPQAHSPSPDAGTRDGVEWTLERPDDVTEVASPDHLEARPTGNTPEDSAGDRPENPPTEPPDSPPGQSPDSPPGESPDSSAGDPSDSPQGDPPESPTCEDPYEPNDVIEEAKEIDSPYACINPAGDVDVYRFRTLTYTEIYATADGLGEDMPLHLTIQSDEWRLTAEGDGGIFVTVWPPGTYYLLVESDATGPYEVDIYIAPWETEPNDEFDQADPLFPDCGGLWGCIQPEGDRDLFELWEVSEPSRISVEGRYAIEHGLAVVVTVHDDSPDHDVVAGPFDEPAAVDVAPGVYYVAVEAADPANTPCYDLLYWTDPVPED
jgi:hypothetical protein